MYLLNSKNTINVILSNHACEIDQAFKPVLVCVKYPYKSFWCVHWGKNWSILLKKLQMVEIDGKYKMCSNENVSHVNNQE